jgi:hypothetical protein
MICPYGKRPIDECERKVYTGEANPCQACVDEERDLRKNADHLVLLYDLERYAGERFEPNYKRGDLRFFLNGFTREPGRMFHTMIWGASASTIEEAYSKVPPGGVHFDRTGNWPSPMVPVEGWYYESAPSRPPEEQRAVTP